MPPQTSAELIRHIQALASSGASDLSPSELEPLRAATRALIAAFKAEGRLQEDPLHLAMTRNVELHREAAAAQLAGRRILVTGGAGCVGTRLRGLLAEFRPAALVCLDVAPHEGPGEACPVDIREAAAVDEAFARHRPEVVFHLASIREPGRAEAVVREAIETNVYGTGHVIAACRRHGVARAVYSSTGKCFAYVTDHVYTGSKKLAEFQWAVAARGGGPTRFATTRFTHVLENGIVARDIAEGIEAGLVGLHGADRFFNVQNLRQATHLLINALALAGEPVADGFWSAVDLGWPVNTLEMALFQIDRSGRDAAVRFLGVPRGYDERFFRGQFDWSGEIEYHPLLNALEAVEGYADSTGTMVGARFRPFPPDALDHELARLRQALDAPAAGGAETLKSALLQAVAGMAGAIFRQTPARQLLDILWWGTAPAWAGPGAAEAARYRTVTALLADALLPSLIENADWASDPAVRGKLLDVATTFALIPGMEARGAAFRQQAEAAARAA